MQKLCRRENCESKFGILYIISSIFQVQVLQNKLSREQKNKYILTEDMFIALLHVHLYQKGHRHLTPLRITCLRVHHIIHIFYLVPHQKHDLSTVQILSMPASSTALTRRDLFQKSVRSKLLRTERLSLQAQIHSMRMLTTAGNTIVRTDICIYRLFKLSFEKLSINHSVLPKGRSLTANSAFSTLPFSQPSFSYLHTVHLS